jgi:hypothetical protein
MGNERQDAVLEILKRLQAGQAAMQADLTGLKADVATLKTGQASMEQRLTDVEVDLGDIKDMVHQLNRRQIRLENKVDDVHVTLKTGVNNLAERVTVLEGR